MNRTTNHPSTYVRGVDKKLDKEVKARGFSGDGTMSRRTRRHPNLFSFNPITGQVEITRKKARKGGNNRSNALGGRKGSKYAGGVR